MGIAVLVVSLLVLAFPALFCASKDPKGPYFASALAGSLLLGGIGAFYGFLLVVKHSGSMGQFDLGIGIIVVPILVGGCGLVAGAYIGAAIIAYVLGSASLRAGMLVGAAIGLVISVLVAIGIGPNKRPPSFDRELELTLSMLQFIFWPVAASLVGAVLERPRK